METNPPLEKINYDEFVGKKVNPSSPKDFTMKGLESPSAIIGGEPLELLAWNKRFADILSIIYCGETSNSFHNQKMIFLEELSKRFPKKLRTINGETLFCTLPTKAGMEKYEMTTKFMELVDQQALLISFIDTSHPAKSQEENKTMDIDFKTLFMQAPVIMVQLSENGDLQSVNNKWSQFTGYELEDIQGKPFTDLMDEQSQFTFNEIIKGEGNESVIHELVILLTLKGGARIPVRVSFSKSESPSNSKFSIGVVSELGSSSTLDDERNLANALRETAAALTSTLNFDEVLDQILVSVGQVVPNEAANVMMIFSGVAYIVRSTGYAERGLEEAVMSLQLPVSQDPHLLSMFETGMPLAVRDVSEYAGIQHYSGTDWPCSVASAPLRSKGQVFGFLNLESSVSGFYDQKHADRLQAFADQAAVAIENARLYAEVQQYAITDELTTLYNRRGLYELGKREVERAHRYSRSLAAIMIDTDGFKSINDTYSHAVGDQVLHGLAERIRGCIREVDIPGRYGGDEFVVLLPETDLQSALQVGERLRASVTDNGLQTTAGDIPISISVGVADLSSEVNTFDILLEKADSAMFKAKSQGKNKVSF